MTPGSEYYDYENEDESGEIDGETGVDSGSQSEAVSGVENETRSRSNQLQNEIESSLEGSIRSVTNAIDVAGKGIDSFLKSLGYDGASAERLALPSSMAIIEEEGVSYIENPETEDRIELDSDWLEENGDDNGELSEIEKNGLLEYLRDEDQGADESSREQADMIEAAWEGMLDEARANAHDGNSDFENADRGEINRASRRLADSPEGMGVEIENSALVNLRNRANTRAGARVLTSGHPGSDDSSSERANILNNHPEWAELSNEAIDVIYGYTEHGINKIFSLSHGDWTSRAVAELEEAHLIDTGDIVLGAGSLSVDSATLGRRNMRIIAEAYNMYSEAGTNDVFLSHCTHGAHRAVFINIASYIIENNCTREEAERANGVNHNFISHYPAFDSQLNQVQDHREEILEMR